MRMHVKKFVVHRLMSAAIIRGAFTDYNEETTFDNKICAARRVCSQMEKSKQMTGGVSIFMPKVLSNHEVQLIS